MIIVFIVAVILIRYITIADGTRDRETRTAVDKGGRPAGQDSGRKIFSMIRPPQRRKRTTREPCMEQWKIT